MNPGAPGSATLGTSLKFLRPDGTHVPLPACLCSEWQQVSASGPVVGVAGPRQGKGRSQSPAWLLGRGNPWQAGGAARELHDHWVCDLRSQEGTHSQACGLVASGRPFSYTEYHTRAATGGSPHRHLSAGVTAPFLLPGRGLSISLPKQGRSD